jgi:hypothetical protein
MDKLTDFTDTTDVSDAAIEWAARSVKMGVSAKPIRRNAGDSGYPGITGAIILAARLIQQHRPELLVDPVDAIVMDALHDEGLCPVDIGYAEAERVGKRLYQMGLEAGKGQSNA